MNPKIRTMIGLTAVAAGMISYTAVSINNERIKQQEAKYQQMVLLAMQTEAPTPIQQIDATGPGTMVPVEQLPADATPMPGVMPEPGSSPKKIIYKGNAPAIPVRTGYSIIVERTSEKVGSTGDPIWKVALVDNTGKELEALKALSGRAYKQTANRHQGGNKSPLPDGIYAIDTYGIARAPFDDPELGSGYWVPITPLFSTGRSALGFHQDPSWGKANGESGTSGCIGLENPEATVKLVDWIRKYRIHRITVVS
jgi:hypothetical protein